MAKPGELVRLTDLEDPWLPWPVRALNGALRPFAARAFPLEPEGLMAEARRRTGLSRFGEPRFREGLEVLCRALDEEARLSAFGRFASRSLLVQQLVARLLLEDLLARHPEIHDIQIVEPLVILGLPRTGTTHLHNLLSQHPGLRSLAYWESLEPFPLPSEKPRSDGRDPRVVRCEQATRGISWLMPHFSAMHEMAAELPHEEMQLLGLDFASMLYEASYAVPSYGAWFERTDHTASYRYLRTVLQALTFLRGGERWLLKTPQHLGQMGPLMAAFPDAKVLHTHRDPARVTVSMVTMAVYALRMNSDAVDAKAAAARWSARVEGLLRAGVQGREAGLVPEAQVMDVRFDELMKDNLAMVERIAAFAGLPVDDAIRARTRAYLEANPPGRHGKIDYRFEDVWLRQEERREALAFYQRRFRVRDEPLES